MNELAPVGHNNPPSELDVLREQFDLEEVENWLDGESVENDDQMAVVDALLKNVKAAENEAKSQKETEFRPHKTAADGVVAKWKITLDDLSRMRTGLIAIVSDYKVKKAEEQEAIRKAKEAEAERLRLEAEAAQRNVDMGNIEERREADAISLEARQASKQASDVEKIKGLRTYTVPTITDPKACLNWIAQNDRPAVEDFMDQYVIRKTREGERNIAGVEIQQEKRAV